MTSPVLVPKQPHRRKRSSFKRQRLAVIVTLCLVAALAVAFAIVHYFTSRIIFYDEDDTRYYIEKHDGIYIMVDADGNELPLTEDYNYVTDLGTIVMVDESTGEYTVVAAVMRLDGEELQFRSYKGTFDILLYPMLERKEIASIHLVNEKGEFTILRNEKDDFEIRGYEDYDYNDIMFASLVVATGYTNTYMRLDVGNAYNEEHPDYDKFEGFRKNGYGEYGLPQDIADAKTYFEITTTSGKTHKVLIGDKILSGAGYYARHADREEVYILKETETTNYSAAFSTVIFGAVEDFVAPLIVTPMDSSNYYDVTDFQINRVQEITEEMLKDPSFKPSGLLSNVITFDFTPTKLREGRYDLSMPYTATKGVYKGYGIDSFKVDDCLLNLRDMTGTRVVKIFSEEEKDTALFEFFKDYKVAYCMEYTHNITRKDADDDYEPDVTSYQQVWISPINEEGNYYLYNDAFHMVVEVSRSHLEYLEWSAYDWVDHDIFGGSIAYLQHMICTVPGYANIAGLENEKTVLEFDNSASIADWIEDGRSDPYPSVGKMEVTLNGSTVITKDQTEKIQQIRLFYETLLVSSLGGMVSIKDCSEEQQQAFRDAAKAWESGNTEGGPTPYLVIEMEYNLLPDGSGESIPITYCFYKYGGGSKCFVTRNGLGSFYMEQDRVEKIMEDLGRVFTGETIQPGGKF